MIAVSIVTYHTDLGELWHCLDSLRSDCVATVTVIDNGSEERIRRFLAEQYPKVEYIPSENVGYGAAHNIALRRSIQTGISYHLVLNSDVRFRPAMLAEAEEYMDAHDEVVLLHPQLTYADGSLQYTARAIPTPADLILRRFLPSTLFRGSRDRYLMKYVDRNRPFECGYVQGSFMLLRVAALERVGLFDERFFMYPEDIDLSRRMADAGKVLCCPALTAVHDHRAASYASGRMLRIHMVNMIRYFNKWGWVFDTARRRRNRSLRN